MNFWATWCPPCIAEMPSLQKLHEDLQSEKDIVFMAIEVDQNIEKAAKFMAKNKYSLPLYTVDSDLPEELHTNSIPMTVILAKNGDIVGKQVGMMDFKSEKLKQGLIDLTKENER
ncbi:Stage IV sporulation protein H [Sphingobacterium daejeonense]|jgi:thiol-disulfide isomerase/thioredoxin|nr:Stage IV sporulation protein H [Sphingobacterium daejeonense]